MNYFFTTKIQRPYLDRQERQRHGLDKNPTLGPVTQKRKGSHQSGDCFREVRGWRPRKGRSLGSASKRSLPNIWLRKPIGLLSKGLKMLWAGIPLLKESCAILLNPRTSKTNKQTNSSLKSV